ncbi:hypothetical protein [Polaribacter sp. Z022]|uniref:hypothetical protein n=1 Tax=Polaribacter sp. Z022 TaxID=2927125 RepID=UPI00202168EF|nr:hypothetical protein [Polaribacter sp. Z022]MCL7752539.1 hypothetical protein [Polaribacter sp. Z022]
MSKPLKYLIIIISIASILFSFYAIYKGQKIIDALGGILIGASLLGVLYFENYSNKKEK